VRIHNVLQEPPGSRRWSDWYLLPLIGSCDAGLHELGAPHSVIFSAFAAQALRIRLNDARPRFWSAMTRRRAAAEQPTQKRAADVGRLRTPSVENVVVVKRTGEDVPMTEARPLVGRHVMTRASEECPAEMDSGHALRLCSGSATGRPRASCTTGGYLTRQGHDEMVFDLQKTTSAVHGGCRLGDRPLLPALGRSPTGRRPSCTRT